VTSVVSVVGFKNPTTLTTLVTIPLAVKRVKVPVIAAGGIGDGRTFLGALALGADAVLLGTVFCAVKECPLSVRRKRVLVDADPYDPIWRNSALATPSIEDIQKVKEAKGGEAIARAVGQAEGGRSEIPKDAGVGTASLAIGFVDDILTAKQVIDGMITEAEEILTSRGIGGWTLAPA
jgi:NAD(P)H-dependent flavin oxidoreductase YrpB (nitropropane dioxygenase family)